MGQDRIAVFHKWSIMFRAVAVCGLLMVMVLFWKFQYGKWCAELIRRKRRDRKKRKEKGCSRKQSKRETAFFMAAVLLAPAILSLGSEAAAAKTENPGIWQEGKVEVALEGDPAGTNIFRDTAAAAFTFHEKNFDETGISITIGDETGRETRLTLEAGEWKGLTGLGEGVLEIVPYENGWLLDSEEGVSEHTENRTVKMRLRFLEEGRYEIREVLCRDLAGNVSEFLQPVSVIVDRTPPRLQIALPEEEVSHEGYYGHPVTVWLYLKEHNFFPEDAENAPRITLVSADQETVFSEGMWAAASEKGKDWYKLPVNVAEDGNYQIAVFYEDPAGWELSGECVTEQSFTVDTTAPEFGEIAAMGETWNIFMEHITFGHYSSGKESVILDGRDSISPVEPLHYFCAEREMTEAELFSLPESAWKEGRSLSIEPDFRTVVYLKVTNYAGLTSYFNSEGLVIENKGPVITFSPRGDMWAASGIYQGDVEVTVLLEDPGDTGVSSGLKQASCILERKREGSREILYRENLLEERVSSDIIPESWQTDLFFSAKEYDGETLWITVLAEDMAENRSEKSMCLTIDQTAPKLQVIYGEEQPENGTYYNQERSVQLVIDEANFSEERVWLTITNTDGALPTVSKWSHKGTLHSCQIIFSEDGDYTFSMRCEDLAGHSSERSEKGFTIDRTPPKLSVEFTEEGEGDSGYYRTSREARVTLEEHNFEAEQIVDEVTAVLDDGEEKAWKLGEFDSRGDIHTASLAFSEDGDYSFLLDYVDLAGNRTGDPVEEVFSVDRIPPIIGFSGLEDESANRGNVEAEVCFRDRRLVPEKTEVRLFRLDQGGKERICQYQELFEGGEQVIKKLLSENFPETEEMDGLYLLRAEGWDLAGNKAENELTFSVNRYGSVYVTAGETKEWLGTGEYSYLPEEREVVIREYNVDPVNNFQAALSRNGELSLLTEGISFQRKQISETGQDSKWQAYEYKIKKEMFEQEGDYEILLYSEDKAGNKMGNEAVKRDRGAVSFAFSVDKTGPSVALSGGEDGGRYKTDQLEVFLDIRDNMKLKKVEVRTKEGKDCYEGEVLDQVLTEEGLKTVLSGADDWQTLELYAEDEAGNRLELGNGHGTGAAGCMEWEFLVTSNWWIQLYRHPVSIVMLILFCGISAAGIILAVRYRKKASQDKNHSKNDRSMIK